MDYYEKEALRDAFDEGVPIDDEIEISVSALMSELVYKQSVDF